MSVEASILHGYTSAWLMKHVQSGLMKVGQRKCARAALLAAGALAACAAQAQGASAQQEAGRVAVVSPAAQPLEMGRALEAPAGSSHAVLVEQVQLLEWTRRQPPRFGTEPSLAERSFGALFQAVSGGGSASQDLARINPDLPE